MARYGIEIKWSLRFILFAMAWVMLEKAIGWHQLNYVEYFLTSFLFALPGFLFLWLVIREKCNRYYQGQMTWMQGTMSGLLTTFLCVLVVPVTTWNVIHFISPDFFSTLKAEAIASGRMPQEEADLFFGFRGYVLDRIQMGLSGGIVASAILAYFLKSK